MRIPKFIIYNKWVRKLLLKLPTGPRWNWVLEVLYPDDLDDEMEIEFKQDKDNE